MKASVIIPGFGQRRDESLAKAEKIVQLLDSDDVEVIVPDGMNVGDARNHGLLESHGEWIAWVDGDDDITIEWVKIIKNLGNVESDIVFLMLWREISTVIV